MYVTIESGPYLDRCVAEWTVLERVERFDRDKEGLKTGEI